MKVPPLFRRRVQSSPILVLGSSGEIGRHVVKQLVDAGVPVRVGVRAAAAGSPAAVGPGGVETIHFDYTAPDVWPAALKGVSAVVMIYPLTTGLPDTMEKFVPALKAENLPLVKMSAAGVPGPNDPNPFNFDAGADHGAADAHLLASGLTAAIVAPTFFATNMVRFQGYTLGDHGAFYGMSGDAAVAYVAPEDVAAVLVKVARDAKKHAGKTYTLTGPAALKESEAAALLATQLGKEVTFVNLPEEDYYKANVAAVGEYLAKNLVALEKIKAAGYAAGVTTDIESVLGRPATPFKVAISDQKLS